MLCGVISMDAITKLHIHDEKSYSRVARMYKIACRNIWWPTGSLDLSPIHVSDELGRSVRRRQTSETLLDFKTMLEESMDQNGIQNLIR